VSGSLTEAFEERLLADGALQALLASYNSTLAIFASRAAAGDAELPYLVISGPIATRSADTKTSRGVQTWYDVRCYAALSDTPGEVDAIAGAVRGALHRTKLLSVDGYRIEVVEVTGPVAADEERAQGRALTVRIIMREQEGS